jgi:subtilisin family serine protease
MSVVVPSRRRAGVSASLALGCLLGASACSEVSAPTGDAAATQPAAVAPLTAPSASVVPGQYIVIFKDGVGDVATRARGLADANGGQVLETFDRALHGFSARMSAQAAEALQSDPSVAFVEADQAVTTAGGVQVGAPWGLDRIDQASSTLDGNFAYPSLGAGVNAYVIDAGIRRTHTQFGGRVVPDFDAVGDGYGPDGCHWHGTHVAGIVGGSTYGVAKGVTLHSVRVADCTGATVVSQVIAGVDWVTANHTGPSVALLSLSTGYSSTLNAAVASSINAGVAYVVAAGNNAGADACNYSPASVANALTVAAITGQDAQTTYTNVGSCVDLYAPGTQIYGPVNTDDNAVALYSGTSQSAAFVAGAAALYLEANPSASPAQVSQAIVAGATTGTVTGLTGSTPNRILRVLGSGGTTTPPPSTNSAPTANFAASCRKANCSFDASSSRDDAGVVRYTWSFGDGMSDSETIPLTSHSYTAKGNYSVTVTLTVTDAAGLQGSTKKVLSIKNGGR